MDIKDIKTNPNNPRIIKDDKYKKLLNSIKEFPKMLELRPIVIDKDNMILGWNMRYKACKELWLTDVPVKIAEDLTEEEKQRFIIEDNVWFWEWNMEMLANEWNTEDLENWWVDINFWNLENNNNIEFVWENKEVNVNWLMDKSKICPKCWFEFE